MFLSFHLKIVSCLKSHRIQKNLFVIRLTLKRVKVRIFVMVIISFLPSLFVLDPSDTSDKS